MPEENNNSEELKPQGEQLPEGFRLVEEGEVIPQEKPAAKQFDPPKIIEAKIDPNTEIKEKPQTFSFTNPKIIHQAQAQPNKGDVANKEEPQKQQAQPGSDDRLKKLDESIKREEASGKDLTYDDYVDSANMYLEGYEGLLQTISFFIDKNGAPSQYAFIEEKKKKLIEQCTKVLRKHPKWVMPIEFAFLGNISAQTTRIIVKASDNRKIYMAQRRKEETENKPPEIVKGGPNKGEIKTRGPGRPRK